MRAKTMQLNKGVFLDLETVDTGDLDRSRLSACLPAWDWHKYTAPGEIPARIENADVVISNKCVLDRAAMLRATTLKLIALAATGANNIDLEAASELGITVCNIRNYSSESVAQHTITLMLNLLTAQPWYWQSVREGAWSDSRQFCLNHLPIRQARGLNFGVIGYGVLGKSVAGLARGLNMNVLIAERKGALPRPGRLGFEQVVRSSDVLSIHCPLTRDTHDLVARRQLQWMKPDALLINTARGGIVNEMDLADCLREGIIAGAAIDTLSEEPPPRNHPLLARNIPRLIVTPHNAWASRTARQAALEALAEVIHKYRAGKPVNQVNPAVSAGVRKNDG
jgi:glycerate dehydrogenase